MGPCRSSIKKHPCADCASVHESRFSRRPGGMDPRADELSPRHRPRYYSLKSNMNLCFYYIIPRRLVKRFSWFFKKYFFSA